MSNGVMAHHPGVSYLDKVLMLVSWALAGAVFLTVGWLAMQPDDPLGAVSLLARKGALMMLLQAAGLAAVTAAIATALAGRKFVDAGTFAASIGMACVSLRGDTAAYLFLQPADGTAAFERNLALKMTGEGLGWFAVIAVSLVVSCVVLRWLFPCADAPAGRHSRRTVALASRMAAADVPVWGPVLLGGQPERQTAVTVGIKHTLITTGVGLLCVGFFSTGLSSRAIEHGQSCFVVAAAVGVACYVADRIVPVQSSLWSILAVPLIAVLGYVWASFYAGSPGALPNLPASPFMRVLPIQYISVGTASVLFVLRHAGNPAALPSAGHGDRRKGAATKNIR